METKKCKHCLEEIPKKAKRCPKCGGKFGLPGFVKILIGLVIIIIIIVAFMSSCTKAVDDAIKETENSYLDIHGKTSFNINETFENSYLKITMTEVNLDFKDYNEYLGPKDGYKVVMAKFEVENIGDSDQYVSTYDFNGYVDNVAMEQFIYANDNYEWLSSTISKGKKAIGYVFVEVPQDTQSVTLEYTASWLDNNKVEFIVK